MAVLFVSLLLRNGRFFICREHQMVKMVGSEHVTKVTNELRILNATNLLRLINHDTQNWVVLRIKID